MEVQPSRQNADRSVGNFLTLLLKNGIGKRQQLRPRHRPQNLFEVIPAHFVLREEVGMQFSRRSRGQRPQLLENPIAGDSLRMGRSTESLRNAIGRGAEIADSTARSPIRRVPEVANQRRHPAMMALREADDLLHLALFLFSLHRVGGSPALDPTAYVFRVVQHGSFVNPKLLQSLVEDVLFYRSQFAHRLFALRLAAELGKNTIQ